MFTAACILILPLRWIVAAVIAGAIHELWHIAVLQLCRVKIFSLVVSPQGAKIETEPMHPVQELICAAAGPLGSFSLLLFAGWMPLLSLLGLLQGLFNLIPVYPMDGGRILVSLFEILSPGRGTRVAEMIGKGVTLLLFCLLFVFGWSNLAILLLICLILRILARKNSCKDGSLGLQ